ncbi:hypothetical protein FDECE_7869 [Fusarium decemcellulare]|nr:hypothetical protein FDECE_7869 [Fusarium decemcellulare]
MYTPLLVLGYVISFASAGCFSDGASWEVERFYALEAAQRLCGDGTLSGDFAINQVKSGCANLSSLKKVDFHVRADDTVLDGSPIPLTSGECTTRLHREINGCGHGGETWWEVRKDGTMYGNLLFTSDPGEGQC